MDFVYANMTLHDIRIRNEKTVNLSLLCVDTLSYSKTASLTIICCRIVLNKTNHPVVTVRVSGLIFM